MYSSLYPLSFAVVTLTRLRVSAPLTSRVMPCIRVARRFVFLASHALLCARRRLYRARRLCRRHRLTSTIGSEDLPVYGVAPSVQGGLDMGVARHTRRARAVPQLVGGRVRQR